MAGTMRNGDLWQVIDESYVGPLFWGNVMLAKYKVDGSGNRWYVWRWGVQGAFWSIISNAYLTKRAATAAMKREMKSNAVR